MIGPPSPRWALTGRIGVQRLISTDLEIEDIKAAVSLRESLLEIETLHWQGFGGEGELKGKAVINRSQPALFLDGRIERASLERLTALAPSIHGVAEGTLEAGFRLERPAGISAMAPLRIRATGRVLEAVIKPLDLSGLTRSLVEYLDREPSAVAVKALGNRYRSAEFDIEMIEDGIAVHSVSVAGDEYTVDLIGKVGRDGLQNLRADLMIEASMAVRMIPDRELRRRLTAPSGDLILPLVITGSLFNPSPDVDLKRLALLGQGLDPLQMNAFRQLVH